MRALDPPPRRCGWSLAATALTWREPVRPDCVGRFEAELRPLRRALPRHALIGYFGPSQDETCHPMMVAQYALAPAWLTELEDPRLRAVTRAEGSLVLPETPSLVLAWGEEGAAWLAAHPDYQLIAPPTEHAQLAARRAR